jgi:hypothetical protein
MTAWFADFSVTPSYAPSKTWSKFYFIEPSKQVVVIEIKQYSKMHMLDWRFSRCLFNRDSYLGSVYYIL